MKVEINDRGVELVNFDYIEMDSLFNYENKIWVKIEETVGYCLEYDDKYDLFEYKDNFRGYEKVYTVPKGFSVTITQD